MTAIDIVTRAAERRAQELLNQASGQSMAVMRLTIDEHYKPLRNAIDEVRREARRG